MKSVHCMTWLFVIGGLVACGSSSSPPQDQASNESFAGQGNVPTEKTCTQNSDCDNHDPCTTFSCKRESGEISIGHCVYSLGDGKGCVAPDAGGGYIAPSDAGPVNDAASAPDVGPNACGKALSVKITTSSLPTCTFNTTVEASSPATLSYACAGGPASVTFGAQTFAGTESGDVVNVSNVSTYTFTNAKYKVNCQYKATQTISGTLASGKLSYSYTETLEPNQPALCPFVTTACTGSGDVSAQ